MSKKLIPTDLQSLIDGRSRVEALSNNVTARTSIKNDMNPNCVANIQELSHLLSVSSVFIGGIL
ncbi:MAG: hypothetical protein KBA66_06395 [Leptospiraceae bacterium]|nr:hypothetical protein [Leptospiraceae bacterium]